MKTRVIRYWHKTDWLYKVEQWKQATGEEKWIGIYAAVDESKIPKAGEWYWSHVDGGLALDRADVIAQRLVNGWQYSAEPDVVAEYGA